MISPTRFLQNDTATVPQFWKIAVQDYDLLMMKKRLIEYDLPWAEELLQRIKNLIMYCEIGEGMFVPGYGFPEDQWQITALN